MDPVETLTVTPGTAISGKERYSPNPLQLTYEMDRFGKTIELPMAAYCPFCRNEFSNDSHGRLVANTGASSSLDYCFDLTRLEDKNGHSYMKCGRCGTTTQSIPLDPHADLDRIHEMTREPERGPDVEIINDAIEAYGSILFPMTEFKRVGTIIAKDPKTQALVIFESRQYRINWNTMRRQVKAFRRGTDEWPGIELKYWNPQ